MFDRYVGEALASTLLAIVLIAGCILGAIILQRAFD
jgi:hypothetical protein